MRIHLGTDHAGLEFSQQLQQHLRDAGHEVIDHGPSEYDPQDDYPSFCINAAQAVANDWAAGVDARGIVFGGSGNGEQMAANKVAGVRAALVWSDATAKLAREHNNANVIAIGARQHTLDEVIAFIDTFLATDFTGESRHVRRITQLHEFELTGAIAHHEVLAPRDGTVPAVLGTQTAGAQDAAAAEDAGATGCECGATCVCEPTCSCGASNALAAPAALVAPAVGKPASASEVPAASSSTGCECGGACACEPTCACGAPAAPVSAESSRQASA